jgi:hypothetical protein
MTYFQNYQQDRALSQGDEAHCGHGVADGKKKTKKEQD